MNAPNPSPILAAAIARNRARHAETAAHARKVRAERLKAFYIACGCPHWDYENPEPDCACVETFKESAQ